MTQTPYSDRLPTSQIIADLLSETELRSQIDRLRAELAECQRRERVLMDAADSLGDMSLRAERRLRESDPSYAAGYEQGMVDAREHILSAGRQANRNRVVADVRRMLAEVGLDPQTGR